MINFDRDYHGYECAKCGQTAPRLVEYYRRDPDWSATSMSMAAWRADYLCRFGRVHHEPPQTGLTEWLIWVCQCGYAFETRTADS